MSRDRGAAPPRHCSGIQVNSVFILKCLLRSFRMLTAIAWKAAVLVGDGSVGLCGI